MNRQREVEEQRGRKREVERERAVNSLSMNDRSLEAWKSVAV